MRLATATLLLAVLGGCVQDDARAETGAGLRDAAILAVAASPAATSLAPHLVEAAVAGHDVRSWPAQDPLAGRLQAPAADVPYLQQLRPLHAIAVAGLWEKLPRDEVLRRVLAGFDGSQFGDPHLLNDDAFALRVLAAAGEAGGPEAAVSATFLRSHQEGGWAWRAGGRPDTDSTGIVLWALREAGEQIGNASAAVGFLGRARAAGGGTAVEPGQEPNCDSTVWAIRAGAALGRPDEADWAYLLSLRSGDGFSYQARGPVNLLCTAEVAGLLADAVAGRVPRPSLLHW